MRASMLRLTAVLVVGALCFLSPAEVAAGPLRDRIREARPGLIFPKRTGLACGSCQSAPVAPAPISDPGLEISPSPTFAAGGVVVRPASGGGCSGGSCPAPQLVPHRTFVIPAAGGNCPGGSCPAPQRLAFPRR